ncbi:hypothetical protein MML48_7g00020789 [Holotrichia oblita]|uniref:Uncharacterized protein n=1 Tax=Holotrichia oblita TaxID=644536 RepID=A0ACB9SVW1_HOLOL|nr:hypothetical protein MML48_7g00020789 [Holotrichia oblita]
MQDSSPLCDEESLGTYANLDKNMHQTHNKVMMAEAKASLSTPKKVGVKGKIIHSQGREIIANVLKFMKEEAGNNTPTIELSHYKERLLAATGISDSTYRSIVKEVGGIDAGGVTSFSSTGKKQSRPSPKSTLRTEEKQTIRTIVHNFYIHDRRRPTIRGGLATLSNV